MTSTPTYGPTAVDGRRTSGAARVPRRDVGANRGSLSPNPTRIALDDTAPQFPAVDLRRAAWIIGDIAAARRLAGDVDAARRLVRLAELVDDEAELLDELRFGRPHPPRRAPAGVALGWLLKHDSAARRFRTLHGLSVPDVEADQ